MLRFENIEYDPDSGVFYRNGKVLENIDKDGYRTITVKFKRYRGHRLAWYLVTGNWPIGKIDHKNLIKTDNRFCNLRDCTHSENCRNTSLRSTNTSGIKCVTWNSKAKKWQVQIRTDLGRIYLGLYEDLEFAELVAHEARVKYHGRFARHK